MAPVNKPKRKRQKHFFKEWREKLDITQDTAINRLGWTQSKLSRIENLVTPYNQDDLESIEEAYGVSKESLLTVNPLKEGEVVDLVRIVKEMSDQDKIDALKAIHFSLDLKKNA